MTYDTWNNKPPKKTCPGSLLGDEWLENLLYRTPRGKPIDQKVKQKEIEKKISRLQRLVARLMVKFRRSS